MDEELCSSNFDTEKFLKKYWSAGSDIRKLQAFRGQIQTMSHESAQVIKKNVFQNYTQFIETAKEISYLESEMYQLSHYLSEQKSLIESMINMPFTATKDSEKGRDRLKGSDDKRKSIQQLLDKVEGCAHLAENSQRYLVFDSDLTELNPDSLAPIRQIHAFLLNDGLMMTSWISHRLGPMRYKYEANYQLDSLAVKNEPDSPAVKNAFRLTVFPEQRMYQCESSETKRQWLNGIDLVKRQMVREGSLARQATIRMRKDKEKSPGLGLQSVGESHAARDSEYESEWLRELPDELEVCLGQRDFNAAIELILEGREHLQECPDAVLLQTVKEKIDSVERRLVKTLSDELKTNDQTSQSGPKSARRAIKILVKLGKSSTASDLYVKKRSFVMKQAIRELKIVDVTVTYVQQLTRLVFSHLIDAGKDFTKLFPNDPGCLSVLLVWASGELNMYVTLLLRHVFDPEPSISVIGHCVRLARTHTQQLSDIGLDLEFELEKLLSSHIERKLKQSRDNFLDAMRLRFSEDKWKPNNLQSEANLLKFLEEVKEIGLDFEPYVSAQSAVGAKSPAKERCWLMLTPQCCHFAKSVIPFARSLGLLRAEDQIHICDETLISVWRIELQYISDSLEKAPKGLILQNAQFLRTCLLPVSQQKYSEAARITEWKGLDNLLQTEFPKLPGEMELIGDV